MNIEEAIKLLKQEPDFSLSYYKREYAIDLLLKDYEKLKDELKECIHKDRIRKFIEENLPDDEIMETCSMYDVNGIYIREELERILGE